MNDRSAHMHAFLKDAGWSAARCAHLAGDASDRSYHRLWLGDASAVLMDAPPGKGDDPADFIHIAAHLRGLGLSAPAVLASDLAHGFLLLEDLGDGLFARLLEQAPADELRLYTGAVDVLTHIHRHAPPTGLPNLSATDWAEAAAFAFDHYARAVLGHVPPERGAFITAMTAAMKAHADGPRVMILRDYHAENLLDLPARQGLARIGLLDFQLAQMGQPGYDLVSLLQDARRDVSPALAQAMIARFAAARGESVADLAPRIAILGAQRALRILGIFARLAVEKGKPQYLRLIPRVWGQLQDNLSHPALAELRLVCAALPAPSTDNLDRIARHDP